MQLALVLTLHAGQREGDILRLSWGSDDGAHHLAPRQGEAINISCTKALKSMLGRYLARTGAMVDSAIVELENVLQTNSAKRKA
jgi:hypothetical protein